jgi:molybdopterin synthase catalytic subunit
MVHLQTEAIDYASLTEKVRRPGAGAVVTFLGTVRDLTGTVATAGLFYEAYGDMALAQMTNIEDQARQRWSIGDLVLVHRLGRLNPGEVSVAVAISSPHRAEAFEACRFVIERVKENVSIWKQEISPDGTSAWVHPQPAKDTLA